MTLVEEDQQHAVPCRRSRGQPAIIFGSMFYFCCCWLFRVPSHASHPPTARRADGVGARKEGKQMNLLPRIPALGLQARSPLARDAQKRCGSGWAKGDATEA